VTSKACRSELDYANALGRPILPVKIRTVAISLAPPRIANAHVVDYSQRDANQALRLAGDMQALPSPRPLPDPLPEPPEVPITYLDTFADEVASMNPMTADRQRQIVEFLRPVASDRENIEDADAARGLLTRMRERGDVTLESATAIDAILARPTYEEHQPGSQQQQPRKPPPEAPLQQPPPPATHQQWSTGVFLLLMAATVFCGGIIGIVVGLLNRNDPAKGGQAKALLWVGVVILAVGIIAGIASAAAEQSTCDPTVEFC
jgi:hypothetical protein